MVIFYKKYFKDVSRVFDEFRVIEIVRPSQNVTILKNTS